jgi:drug/metabolite transporter (DMT)-like permease
MTGVKAVPACATVASMPQPGKSAILSAFAALYLIWGSTYLAIRFAIETIPPLLMAGTRFLVAGFIIYGIARGQGAPKSSLANWRTALIVGGCLLLGGNGGVTLSEQYVSSGLASVIVATVPIYMALLAWWSGLSPRPAGILWVGLAGGLAGVVILLAPALRFSPNESTHPAVGMVILLCSSFIWSAGSIYSRKARSASPPFLLAAQQMICGGALLIVAGLFMGEQRRLDVAKISVLSIGSFAYLVIIGAIVGYTAYIFLLRHCAPAKVATYAYVNPIVAVVLGALFAGETLSGQAILAAALIIGSVALVITVQQAKSKPAPAAVGALETASET